jgi:hypothetical protein
VQTLQLHVELGWKVTLDNNKALEYIFWLKSWNERSSGSSFAPNRGQFKCIIDRRKISIIPVENNPDKEISIDISQIQKCKLRYAAGEPNRSVELVLNGRRFFLFPINPFEPNTVLYVNHSEANAMINVIDSFRSNMDPKVDPNLYLRQMKTKDSLKRFRNLNQSWDAHTSPWVYNDLYGDKFLWPKTIAFIVIVAIVVTALLIGIVYVLDTLKII